MRQLTVYLDFDGTMVEHAYPNLGHPVPYAIQGLKELQLAGHQIILNTYRADISQEALEEAQHYLMSKPYLLPIFDHCPQKKEPRPWDLELAIARGELYIDDIAASIPLVPNEQLPNGMMVDWKNVLVDLKKLSVV